MPGMLRIRLSSLLAYAKFASRLAPRICRSIGAGAPKFRIWLTMSAGRNEKLMPGNSRGNCSRSAWTYSAGRLVTFLELDLDVAVLRADHAGVVVGHVDAGDRHADIVDHRLDLAGRNDLADRLLHVGELVGGLLDAGADLGADMHQDVAGVDRRKEVAAEKRHQQERQRDHGEEAGDEQRPPSPAPSTADRDRWRGCARTAPRSARWTATSGLRVGGWSALMMDVRLQADISPSSAPACATG